MTSSLMCFLASMLAASLQAAAPLPPAPADEDPRIRAVVEAFFAAQEAEDADAYLALWSGQAQKPHPDQLAYVFKSGDDRFSGIAIRRVVRVGDLRRVIVSVVRERTAAVPRPDGKPSISRTMREWSLTLVPEGDALKILSEGFPADDLATSIIAAPTADERAALMDAEPQAVNARLVSAIMNRADSLAQAQRYAASREVYERALEVAERVGNRQVEGQILQSIANSYYFEQNLPRALEFYERRLALERAERYAPGLAGALMGVATVKYSSFEYADALAAYEEARAVYDTLGDDAGAATALLSSGNVKYLQGEYAGAARDYTRSRELCRVQHDTVGEARALEGLGRVLMAQGDYAGALDAFAGVLEEGRARNNRVMLANALHSTGEVHLRLGNSGAARAAFAESRGHFEAAPDAASVGRSWQGTALSELIAARFAPAEEAYANSMKACAGASDQDCVARANVGLAFAQYSQDHFDKAVASYRRAIEAFTALKKGEEIGRAEVGLSQALFGRRDFAGAAAAAAGARSRTAVYDVVWRAHLAEARAHRGMKAPEPARAAARAAVDSVEAMARAALDQPTRPMSPDGVSAYMFLAVLQAEGGDAAAAFESVERGRAHALRVALAPHDRDIVRHMTADEREAERAAAARLGSLLAQIEKEEALPKPNAPRLAQLRALRDSAAAERLLLQEQLFDRRPDLRTWRGLAPAASREEVERFVAADGAPVVQVVIDQDDLLAVVATPGEEGVRFTAAVSATPRRTLAELVAAAIMPESLQDGNEWRTRSAPLVAALPAAARAVLTSAPRATLILDDILWRVPFEALPVEEAYLAASVDLAYATSVTALVRAAAVEPPDGTQPASGIQVVAVAAPALADDRLARIGRTSPDWKVRDADTARREALVVAGRAGDGRAYLGDDAIEKSVRAALGSARLVHLGAPFRVNSASPLFSPLLLAEPARTANTSTAATASPQRDARFPTRDPHDDGVLELREVANLDVAAEAVVLSDGTALSMRDAAGAVPVVRWVWRAGGAGALMLRRWPDEHPSADTFLGDFHARVQAGDDPRTALAGARATLRAEPARAPWFWASWIVIR